MSTFTEIFLTGSKWIIDAIDGDAIEAMAEYLNDLRTNGGRLFMVGVGGSAAACSHAAADFRKLCAIDAYSFDNLPELTARTNDEGWDSIFTGWLNAYKLDEFDAIMVISVGGGAVEANISQNIVAAIAYAKVKKATILGIVGRDGGWTKISADICLVIPTVDQNLITAYTESFHSMILHLLTFHPSLAVNKAKWESNG
jgi:D-sedoheptulose 7-phosphate isomerase